MSKNTLFIGNGFDLSIGMKTRYSDFAQSKFWTKDETSPLAQYLDKAKEESNWFDIENLLERYAKEAKFEIGSAEQEADMKYYYQLCKSLEDYINGAERNINGSHFSLGDKLLDAVSVNGHFDRIYSFNYTCLEKYAEWKNKPLLKDSVVQLHGSTMNHSIILGISDETVPMAYHFLIKSWNPAYKSHNVYDRLKESDLIVFYGLSFGAIDFIYFKDFIEDIINKRSMDDNRKKIAVFTYNEQSRLSIIENLHSMGININDLFAYCDLTFYTNYPRQNTPNPEDFFNWLKEGH